MKTWLRPSRVSCNCIVTSTVSQKDHKKLYAHHTSCKATAIIKRSKHMTCSTDATHTTLAKLHRLIAHAHACYRTTVLLCDISTSRPLAALALMLWNCMLIGWVTNSNRRSTTCSCRRLQLPDCLQQQWWRTARVSVVAFTVLAE